MAVFAQLVVIGLTTGAIYGLLALGLVTVYRAAGVLNIAAAGTGAAGAYLLHDLMDGSGGGGARFVFAFAAGAALAILLGVAVERFAVRPLRESPSTTAPLVATAAVLLLVQGLVTLRYGGAAVAVENPLPRAPYRVGAVGGETIFTTGHGLAALAALAAVGAALFFAGRRGRWGVTAAWAAGSAVAAVACMLFATGSLLFPGSLAFLQVKAMVVAVFAGLSDLRLCVLGGPLLGVAEALAGHTDIAGLDQSVAFFALLAVVVARSRTPAVEARA